MVPAQDSELPPYSPVDERPLAIRRQSLHVASASDSSASSVSIYESSSPTSPVHSSSHTTDTKHDFYLARNGIAWATLSLYSSAASPRSPPQYSNGDSVEGHFVLNLNKSENIQKISIDLKGNVTANIGSRGATLYAGMYDGGAAIADMDSIAFLDHSVEIWSRGQLGSFFDGKQAGQYHWKVDFLFPTEARGKPLPSSFRSPKADVTVQYTMTLNILRKGAFRSGDKVQFTVVYRVLKAPDPPSLLRQIAYRHNRLVPGPRADPEGWETLPSFDVHGELIRSTVVLRCELSLAKPLCYTRGTVIPINLRLKSLDNSALTSLGSPSAIVLVLQRSVSITTVERRTFKEDIFTAVWRPRSDDEGPLPEKELEGEIHLPKDLYPSTDSSNFSVAYRVVLRPFKCPAFVPRENKQLLLDHPVEICSLLADGPLAISFSSRDGEQWRQSGRVSVEW